jgi:hypothetical protein
MIGVYYDSLLEDGKPKKTWEMKETTIGLAEAKETHLHVWLVATFIVSTPTT